MSLVELSFFCFLLVTLIVYFGVGARLQKYVLLAASIIFFVSASGTKAVSMLLILASVVVVTYVGARLMDTIGKKRYICVVTVISLLVVNLVVLKYVFNLGELFLVLFRLDADI